MTIIIVLFFIQLIKRNPNLTQATIKMLKENVYVMNSRNKNMLNGKWEFKNITRQPIISHMEYAEWLLVINKLNHKKHFFVS